MRGGRQPPQPPQYVGHSSRAAATKAAAAIAQQSRALVDSASKGRGRRGQDSDFDDFDELDERCVVLGGRLGRGTGEGWLASEARERGLHLCRAACVVVHSGNNLSRYSGVMVCSPWHPWVGSGEGAWCGVYLVVGVVLGGVLHHPCGAVLPVFC
jgi:hypothetical protein